ncbi:MAG: winged helix-turn-helix domain-containing protein [Thermoplasmatales archaeon]|nr:winged helix-turn-helix domain-containing protein [Thermoplasmatales archaeon]
MEAKIFDKMYEEFREILISGVKMKILMSLLEGTKTSRQLMEEIGISLSSVLHTARELEDKKYIEERKEGFVLTPAGKIVGQKVLDLTNSFYVTGKHKEFWLTHDVDGIPKQFIARIGEIRNTEIVKSSPKNLLQVLALYVKHVSKAKELAGISPVYVEEFSNLVKKLLNKGAKIRLVISKNIADKVFEAYKKEADEELRKKVEEGNLKIWLIDDVKIAMTVTESFVSIGLFNLDGTYDFSQDLVSYDEEAIEWGRELFEYYKSRAKEVSIP